MDDHLLTLQTGYRELINPPLAERLGMLRLDKSYHRSRGSRLFYNNESGKEVEVIDFVSGYGSVLLGHNEERLRKAAVSYLEDNRPGFVQLSVRETAVNTAEWLNREMKEITGKDYITTFANSGAEAVEAAIKHALIEFNETLNEFKRRYEQDAGVLILQLSRKNETLAAKAIREIRRFRELNEKNISCNEPLLLAARYAYHGKTIRAAMTCWNTDYNTPFSRQNSVTVFADWEKEDPVAVFDRYKFSLMLPGLDPKGCLQFRPFIFNRIAAAIIEPIQGEGGIRPLPGKLLQDLQQQCGIRAVPLIMDEIQTGCYRTGTLLASAPLGVIADYYLLGKALGGGLAKISALLIDKKRYRDSFGLTHSSTFAEDGWSSFVSLHALQLSKEATPAILEKGEKLMQRLQQLREHHPSVVKDVRGLGLMVGLELKDFSLSNSYCFQVLARSGYLHYVCAAYLLNTWNLRLAAPLSAPNVLRIQPAVSISDKELDHLLLGLYELCHILDGEDFYKLIEFCLPEDAKGLRAVPGHFCQGDLPLEEPAEGARRIGFVTHFIDCDTIRKGDPSLAILDDHQLEALMERILPFSTPALLGSLNVTGNTGRKVHLTLTGLSMTSAMCRKAITDRNTQPYADLCEMALRVLKREAGAEVAGLGQFTSILTNNGLMIHENNLAVTTGNSYTVYLAMEAIRQRMHQRVIDIGCTRIGIIGAAGNIASVIAELFSAEAGGLLLIGNQDEQGYRGAVRTARNIYQKAAEGLLQNGASDSKGITQWMQHTGMLEKIKSGEIRTDDPRLYEILEVEFGNDLYIRVARSYEAMQECGVVVVAANAATAFLDPGYFSPGTILCDISVPHSCGPGMIHNNRNIDVFFGGIAALPYGETIPVKGFPLKSGHVFGCMAETLLLGLEGITRSFSLGPVYPEQVQQIGKMAARQGFTPVVATDQVIVAPETI